LEPDINIINASGWCKVVQSHFDTQLATKTKNEPSTRTSVTLSTDIYASLEIIAKQKKVSVAWVIRDAAERYVSEQWPLFADQKNGG
jgi:predicted DNA-binding ribbon-helix-helix protein